DLALVQRAPALLLDRRPALAMQRAEGDVAALGRQREPDRDADQAKGDGAVPDRPHGPPFDSSRTSRFRSAWELPCRSAGLPLAAVAHTTPAASESSVAPAPARTIGAMWCRAVAEERSFPAYLVEDEPGHWRE